MALNLFVIIALKLICHLCFIRFKNFISNEITFELFTLIYVATAICGV
jgi:hypothetical protein